MGGAIVMFVVLPVLLFVGGYLLLFTGDNLIEAWAGRIFGVGILIPIILIGWFLYLFSNGGNLFSSSGSAVGGEGLYYYLIFVIAGLIFHFERVLSFIAIVLFYTIVAYLKFEARA